MAEAATMTRPVDSLPADRRRRNRALIALLDSWMDEDAEEHRDTFEFLRRALDEDRPTGRKLFPER